MTNNYVNKISCISSFAVQNKVLNGGGYNYLLTIFNSFVFIVQNNG